MGSVMLRDLFDAMDKTLRGFQKAAPKASIAVLKDFTGRKDLALPELVLETLHKLSGTGPIKRKGDKRAIKAISWLLDGIPYTHSRRNEIIQLFDNALHRSKLFKEEKR